MKKYAIFDLDNCISDDSWRVGRIDWNLSTEQGRYADYHDACDCDAHANMGVVEDALQAGYELIFLTGRPADYYTKTRLWIANAISQACDVNLGKEGYNLLMRSTGDHRPAVEVKRDMLHTLDYLNMPRSSIAVAYDDRQDIVDMYRSEGIPAHHLWVHDRDAYSPPTRAQQEHDALAHGILPNPHITVTGSGTADNPHITMTPPAQPTAADILAEAAETFRQRNAVYGSNYEMVGPIMKILFPQGVDVELLSSHQFHLFELMVVKMSRLAISRLTHVDSARDASVYAAMIEMCINAAMIEMCIKNREQA